jgi:hypothetical protein
LSHAYVATQEGASLIQLPVRSVLLGKPLPSGTASTMVAPAPKSSYVEAIENLDWNARGQLGCSRDKRIWHNSYITRWLLHFSIFEWCIIAKNTNHLFYIVLLNSPAAQSSFSILPPTPFTPHKFNHRTRPLDAQPDRLTQCSINSVPAKLILRKQYNR